MKIIKITTDNEISVHEFPEGSYSKQNEILRLLIGQKCEMYKHVMPNRLYEELGGSNKICRVEGSCVSMLVDEEGLYHDLDLNLVGSYLYETDLHGFPIAGTILIIAERHTRDGIDFCGFSEEQFNLLYPKLEELTKKVRGIS